MNTQTQKTGAHTEISRHWLNALEEHNVSFMVLDLMHDTKLIELLQTRPNWVVEYATEDAIFFAREELPANI